MSRRRPGSRTLVLAHQANRLRETVSAGLGLSWLWKRRHRAAGRPGAALRDQPIEAADFRGRRRGEPSNQPAVFGHLERFALLDPPQVDRQVLSEFTHTYSHGRAAFAHVLAPYRM